MLNAFTNIPSLPYNWKQPVNTVALLPINGNTNGDTRVALDTFLIYIWNGSSWTTVGSSGIGSNVAGGTPGSVLFIDSTSKLAQNNSNFYWDNTHKILSVGTNTPVVAWTPSTHQTVIMVNGSGDGTTNDFPIFAFSQNANGPSPFTQGALYWINNNPADAGEYGVIASIRQDGTNQFGGAGSSNGFVFSARTAPTDPNPATDFLRIRATAAFVTQIDSISDPSIGGNLELLAAGHLGLTMSYSPSTGPYQQADGSWVKDDGNNLGVFGGLETFYQSAYKYGFFGTGGVRIGASSATWSAPTYLLEIQGLARNSYTQYKNNAATSGILCGLDAAGNGQLMMYDAFPLSFGTNGTASYQITTGNILKNLLVGNEATGSGTPLAGSNCPAVNPTTPYTWVKMISSDGSTIYVAGYK